MRSSGRARLFAALAALAAAIVSVDTGSASAWEYVNGPPKESVVAFNLSRTHGRHVLTVRAITGYCIGEPAPVAGPVKVIERPISAAHPRPAAIIVAHQIQPEPTEISGKVKPGEIGPVCEGVGYEFEEHARTKRPVAGLLFYNGSFDPPKLVPLLPSR